MRPKQHFQKNEAFAKAWADLTVKPEFNEAVNAALLEMVERQPIQGSPNESWDRHSQLVGARTFLDILRNLHLPEANPVAVPFPNLKSPR